jgi:hypothetical protein
MSIRKLSLTLDLDTGQFKASANDAAGVMRTLSRGIEDVSKYLLKNNQVVDGSVRSLRAYTEQQLRLNQTQAQLRSTQDQYVKGLLRELDTLGMNAAAVRDYNAAQLGLVAQTRSLREALDEKAKTLAMIVEAERALIEAEREATAVEAARIQEGQALTASLREQIVTLREGATILAEQKAEALGVGEEFRVLTGIVGELNAQYKQGEETLLAYAETDRIFAEAVRENIALDEARIASGNALLTSIREQVIVLKGGTEALQAHKAAALGISAEYEVEAKKLRDLNAEIRKGEAILLANAKAEREANIEAKVLTKSYDGLTRSAHGSGRAIYELNVITHELSSGRIRQAISSFSILLNNIGLAGGAVLGLTLSIGLLYGLSKPIEAAAKHMEDLKHQSQELGLSVSFLQTLGIATDLYGIKTEKLVAGIARLDVSFANARAGSKKAKDGYDAVGVSLKNNYTNQELLQNILKGWSKLEDGPRKVAVATELFGRSGKDLIGVLNDLANHYDEIEKKAEKYGLKNAEAVKVGAELAAQFREQSLAAQGFGLSLLTLVGPGLIGFLKGMTSVTESLGHFFKNKELMTEASDAIKAALVSVAAFMGGQFLVSTVKAGNALLVMLTTVDAISGVSGFGLLINSLKAARIATLEFTAALLLNPMTWVAIAAVALGAGMFYLWQQEHKVTEAQAILNKVQDEAAGLADKLAASTEETRKVMKAKAEQDLVAAKNALALARANIAAAESEVARQNAVNEGTHLVAGDRRNGYIPVDHSQVDQAKKDAAARLATVNAIGAEIEKIGSFKPEKAGTTAGDPPKTPKAAKIDPGLSALSKLKEELAGIKGAMNDAGSTYSRYEALLNDTTTALHKSAAAHKGLREQILAEATQIDAGKAYKALKDDADKQHDLATRAKADLEAQLEGGERLTLAEIRASNERLRLAKEAKNFAGGKVSSDSLSDRATANARTAADIATDSKNLDDMRNKTLELTTSTRELWNQYNSGATKADASAQKIIADTEKLLAKTTDPRARRQIKAEGDRQLEQNAEGQGITAAEELRNKTKAINAELTVDTAARERAILQIELDSYRRRIDAMDHSTEAYKRAYADYLAYVEAANRKAKSETPFGKMAKEWGDMTGNMQRAGARWMDSFVTDLARGKLNFKDFTKAVLADIAEIIIKALIAKYVLGPLEMAFGGVGGGGGGLTAASDPSMAGLYHSGGMVGEAGGMRRGVDNNVFTNAYKYHTGGIAGLHPNEVPAILQKGEGVFTQAQMKQMARGGGGGSAPPVQINLNNQSGTPLDADHGGTSFDGEKYILDVVVSHMGRPGALRSAIKSSQ